MELENNYYDVVCMKCGTTIDLDKDDAMEATDNNGEETFLCGHCGEGLEHCLWCWCIVDLQCRGTYADGYVGRSGNIVCGKCVPDNEDIAPQAEEATVYSGSDEEDEDGGYSSSSSTDTDPDDEHYHDESDGEYNEENEDYYSCSWRCAKCKCYLDSARGYEGIVDNNNSTRSNHDKATYYFCRDCVDGMDQCDRCLCVVDIQRRGVYMDGFIYQSPRGFTTLTHCARCAPSNEIISAASSITTTIYE